MSYIKKNNNTITFYCLKKKPNIDLPVEISGTCRNTIADITIEEGIDTSDATATAEDILSGKTAYVNGEKITGSYEGVELNFEIVGGTTEPTNPTENMIWVNTDTDITGYYFSRKQPENMTDGEVWIYTGVDSNAAFDIVDDVTVYPLNVNQMVSGTLVNVTAKSYQDGEWVEWLHFYFREGTGSTIGTWSNVQQAGITNPQQNYVQVSTDCIAIVRKSTIYICLATQSQAVDLTDINTLYFEYESGFAFSFGVTKTAYTYSDTVSFVTSKGCTQSPRTMESLDVSTLTGSYYIMVYTANATMSTCKIYNVYGDVV